MTEAAQLIDVAPEAMPLEVLHIVCCRKLIGDVAICGTPVPPGYATAKVPAPDETICAMCWVVSEVHAIPQCFHAETTDCPRDAS